MSKDELKQIIRNNRSENNSLSLSDLYKIKGIANIKLEIDRETNDYYYKVKLDNLVNKTFDAELLTNSNWKLSTDEEYICLFI